MSQLSGLTIERAQPADVSAIAGMFADAWVNDYCNVAVGIPMSDCERQAAWLRSDEQPSEVLVTMQRNPGRLER